MTCYNRGEKRQDVMFSKKKPPILKNYIGVSSVALIKERKFPFLIHNHFVNVVDIGIGNGIGIGWRITSNGSAA